MSGRTYTASERVSTREVEGELILLDLEDGSFFVARGTSPRIWEMLVAGSSTDAVVDEVTRRYGVDREQAAADLRAFVDDLVERGFLVEAGG